MRRGRDIGELIFRPAQPGTPLGEPADIIEMMADIFLAGTN